jgi:GNAT superfamily N-acetyltransferase
VRHGDLWQSRQSGSSSGKAEVALNAGTTVVPGVDVLRTFLELTEPAQLHAAPMVSGLLIERRPSISVEHYRRLYHGVGSKWQWIDRNVWSDEQLASHLASPKTLVWECLIDNDSAGFFELSRQDDGSVEIAYFGLMEGAMGRGFGKALLTRAVEEAWSLGATRVWLHTCTLDSPRALPNYRARGFREVKTEMISVEVAGDVG